MLSESACCEQINRGTTSFLLPGSASQRALGHYYHHRQMDAFLLTDVQDRYSLVTQKVVPTLNCRQKSAFLFVLSN